MLILAAGIGRRYGGLKQIEPVGPGGETIVDYSVYDALRAGFDRVVFVIRRDIERPFRESIGSRFETRIDLDYAFQDEGWAPPGVTLPANRKKPWGTGHAILTAAGLIRESFGVINADDFYGAESFQLLIEHLQLDTPEYAMAGYVLRNTLSEFGSVARGICQMKDGHLESVQEIIGIEKYAAAARYPNGDGELKPMTGDEIVSMNMWGFRPGIFDALRSQFAEFLKKARRDEKAEFYVPTVVNELIRSGQAQVKVLRTRASWFGVTYREDRAGVTEGIRRLIRSGRYPERLWE